MATDKKNRAQRDDKESIESVDNGNSSADASASLHARRAKLRGALGGKNPSFPATEPFTATPSSFQQSTDPSVTQADPYAVPSSAAYAASTYGASHDQQGLHADPYGNAAEPYQPDDTYEAQVDLLDNQENQVVAEPKQNSFSGSSHEPGGSRLSVGSNASSSMASPFEFGSPGPQLARLPIVPDRTMELVNSIDQSLDVCATNLAALQNLAGEQTEVLKGLSQTLQNQTLLEIGLNLNSLTESLTAALEPMKAIGELVPALDALVSSLEGKEQEQSEKMSPDQLVTNLSDQLSAGLIDPWTFKCAFMAVYPADHIADLLHRLVELLGTQRLSGDLFRAAYEAVQAAESPARSNNYGTGSAANAGEFRGGAVFDENIKAQLDNLERSNRDLQKRQEEREQELAELLVRKDHEMQTSQEQLNQRLEELNSRYADAADMITSREEEFRAALESKDMDIIEKDAELNMLRAQMEELRSQTEEMAKELQKEMQAIKLAAQQNNSNGAGSGADPGAQVNSQGFFDSSSSGSRPPSPGLFDAAQSPSKGAFAGENKGGFQEPGYAPENFGTNSGSGFSAPQSQQSFQSPQNPAFQSPQNPAFQSPQNPAFQPPPNPAFQAPPAPAFQPPQPVAAPQPAPVLQQIAPRPAQGGSPPTQPFGGQTGSYGMGVRQQVFEVIVRQALAGAPWREICAGPMQVNNISPDEVESEVKRRQSLLNK